MPPGITGDSSSFELKYAHADYNLESKRKEYNNKIGGLPVKVRHVSFHNSFALILTAVILSACAGSNNSVEIPENAKVQALYIVDCLLPGQVRRLGNTSYLTPRRPERTTAADCNLRGGEYVAFDAADYKTALKVWLPAAEEGEANAQNAVGEIFERGLGSEPNYEVAHLWYEKAAKQGHKGAQFNLGTLYETGKGVKKDKLKALNWYRLAWGISDDSLMLSSDAEKALKEQAKATLKIAQASSQPERGHTPAQELPDSAANAEANPRDVWAAGKQYGHHYALIIGNANYRYLEDLATPVTDGQKIASVLSDRYGYKVQLLANGDDASVLQALNQLNTTLTEEDNLLIYYSGHGNRRSNGSYETGYWLPVNAEPPPNDTYWVPTEQVSSHLARIKARRIIVIADSSFAGLLADNPAFLLASSRANLQSEAYIALRFPNKSRLLLSSGQDYPLVGAGNSGTSAFAAAFIAVLEKNNTVMTAPALYLSIIDELGNSQPKLTPQFKAIKRAGDEVGDYFFVAPE